MIKKLSITLLLATLASSLTSSAQDGLKQLFNNIGVLRGHSLAAENPNIIVFLSDDHGMLDSTPYGSADVRTPNMQRLADAGMTFTRPFKPEGSAEKKKKKARRKANP